MKERNAVLDIARGIGILLMVAGHSGMPGTEYIYLFHVPLFFILSGWVFNSKHSADFHSVLRFVWGKIKRLWFPFVAANTAFTLLNNVFLHMNILTADPRITELAGNVVSDRVSIKDIIGRTLHWCVFDGGTQLGGALWFIPVLFQITVLHVLLDYLMKRYFSGKMVDVLQGVVSVLLLTAGYACQQFGGTFWQLPIACSSYILYYMGHMLSKYKIFQMTGKKGFAYGISALLFLILAKQFGSVDLASNFYTNPFFLVACAFAGWILVWEIALLCSGNAAVTRFMCTMGQHTMPILILHFLAFKAVTWCGISIFGMEDYLLAAFPVYFKGGIWWILYTAAGTVLPLLAYKGFDLVKNAAQRTGKLSNA